MDRIYLVIIAAAILVMVGAFSLYVTKAGEFAPARTIGAADCSSKRALALARNNLNPLT
jgi:hypothetical protein